MTNPSEDGMREKIEKVIHDYSLSCMPHDPISVDRLRQLIADALESFAREAVEEDRDKNNYFHRMKEFEVLYKNARKEALTSIQKIVNEQAADEALWSVYIDRLQPISEAYLQQELRRLHAAIELISKDGGQKL